MKTFLFLLVLLIELTAGACIWDSDTLSKEQRKSPDIAKVILGETAPPDPIPLRNRIKKLQADPRKDDPAWWNDLAGAHLRLGEAPEAAALLEPILNRFPDDYGMHANLGTAYHLLGRYQEAEKEIARDLEINPNAHFGFEKYHLALLQYLVRDPKYQTRHVYVDEFSTSLLQASGPFFLLWDYDAANANSNSAPAELIAWEEEYASMARTNDYEAGRLLVKMSLADERPSYRAKWNLARDPNFEKGVMYMATLNPKQPAAFVMLGVASWRNRDLNLAASAFERAVALGSPQSETLKRKVEGLRDHISRARAMRFDTSIGIGFAVILLVLGVIAVFWFIRKLSA